MSTFSTSGRRILSVWLPRLPTDRFRRLQRQGNAAAPDADSMPLVAAAKIDNALQVTALNDAAATAGLMAGMPLATARAMLPALEVIDADPVADAKMLNAIADWCDRFTPLVALDGEAGLLLDITGCAHLFGGEAQMLAKVCDGLSRQGFIVSGAIAGTSVAARALTRHVHGRIVACGREAAAVAPLPVASLEADEKIVRGLTRAGLKTIGDVAARKPAEITARFGAAFTATLQQALGQGDTPISPRKPAPDYMAEKRFAEPVATQDAIALALSSLATVLIAAMERHGKGARLLEAGFFRTDGAVRTIAVEAGQPITRVAVVERLFAERLDALSDPLDPGFGFDLVRLSALHTSGVAAVQHGFDTAANEAEDVGLLVDRLAARIGRRRIIRYLPQDTHIPEQAALAVPAQEDTRTDVAWPQPVAGEPPLRPLRLFAQPEAIDVTADFPDGAPAQFRWRRNLHVIVRTEGPERIAMEWWRHRDPPLEGEGRLAAREARCEAGWGETPDSEQASHPTPLASRIADAKHRRSKDGRPEGRLCLPLKGRVGSLQHAISEDEFLRMHPPQPDTTARLKADSSMLTRDYFRAEDRQGLRYWIYREGIFAREAHTFRWFLHGLFA